MDYREAYQAWLLSDWIDDATKEELRAISDNEEEIRERFYMDLEFGTAGLRGIIGAGTNRMNPYTVRNATQGLANYILKVGGEDRGVAIAYDSRHMSPEFADEAALCLAANGIKAFVFTSLRPTPELSFAVREKGCIAGINITASHNPPEYNGYKVYWEDGAQITPPHDVGITEEVRKVTDFSQVKTMAKEEAVKAGLYIPMDSEVDDAYMAAILKEVRRPEAIQSEGANLKIVYTPLHGTGNIPVQRILRELGFSQVYVVPEQEEPDGDFPTVSYPNPEADEAFELGLALAEKIGADLVLATDPDADRLGVRVRDKEGKFHTLTGNMSGCLLADYEISSIREKRGLPSDGALIKSIVSSNLADEIAKYYGVELIEVLTGFKYIGGKMLEFERSGKGTYLFGFEESYGCLIGSYARDKDAVSATMALCEAAAYYRTKGITLWEAMLDLYGRCGYMEDHVTSITRAGIKGKEEIAAIMEGLRNNTPEEIGGYRVLAVRDYLKGEILDLQTGASKASDLPSSNVLYYELEDSGWICVRPSGTEPKIKFYLGVKGESMEDAKKRAEKLGEEVLELQNERVD